jgi:excinuclease ABC subunit A
MATATKDLHTGATATEEEVIEIIGAREHNLKNINASFPRNRLVVITGISGSGKSSLAFDTLYAEGQRRYMESFSAYARSFIGNLERPDVDKINGLSPVISIEQKTTTRNPRSTVGTVTEIYDFMRLLFARAAEAYSYLSGKKMTRQSEDQILDAVLSGFAGRRLTLLAPVVKGRKGHYRELFVQIRKSGYTKVRIDGELTDLVAKMQVDRYKIHDIEVVIDRIAVDPKDRSRIAKSIHTALKEGKGVIMVLDEGGKVHHFSKYLMDPETGLSYDEPAPNNFSFNSPYGACPACNGLGQIEEITKESVIPDDKLSISRGGILPLGEYRDIWIFKKVEAILKRYKLTLTTPIRDIPEDVLRVLLYGDDVPVAVASVKYPGTEWNTKFEGIVRFLEKQRDEGSEAVKRWVEDFTIIKTCPACNGARLKKESLHFLVDGMNIAQLSAMDIRSLKKWFDGLESRLSERQNVIAAEVLKEIRKRVGFLLDVGLDYLHLNRTLRTLSGGEAQRIRLATQIGTQLVGVLYILDEPSIGLHARDNDRLIRALKNLRDLGNTVLVVEHDKEMMLASDYVVDIGPGAGRHGGHIVAEGPPKEFLKQGSATAKFLTGKLQVPMRKERRKGSGRRLRLTGASGNNLKNVSLEFPLGTFVCITGVSGSGKSTLIHDTLFPILNKHFFGSHAQPLAYKKIDGLDLIDKVIEVDQSPIGRTPRSNPATYTGVFTDIRDLFAQLPEAKIRGYKPGRFSFNVKGGRCETCEGAGLRLIEMEFLPDIQVPCESCKGKRYNRETLEVRFKGKSISDVLDMTVEEAVRFFENQPRILRKIKTLHEVGLDYISVGQQATTLSGGEAQRVKLSTELSKRDTGKTLYILDEPTTGLHFQDISHLLGVLHKLVDKGNTVLVIEHNLDVIRSADWVIDLGPEGGERGGTIVAAGTPEEVARCKHGFTGAYLKKELAAL